MERYTISNVEVEFPFRAYPCQLVYMEKVIQALQQVSPVSPDFGYAKIIIIH